jgi:hypothetical protein
MFGKEHLKTRENIMILHEATDNQNYGKDFPAETPALMPLDSFETVPGTGEDVNPLPFFVFGDEDEDMDDEDDFDDVEDDFDDDNFEDDDFDDDDDDDDDFEDEDDFDEDEDEFDEEADYDEFDE